MDPSLQPAIPLFYPGPQYHSSTRQWQGVAGIERTSGGRLWASWYSGGKNEGSENYVLLVWSDDDGTTWSAPSVVIDPPGAVRAFDPVLWRDPLDRLWWFWTQSEEHYDGRCGVWAIIAEQPDDREPVWSAPRRLADGVLMNKATVLSSGEWLLPVTIWDHSPITHPAIAEADRIPHVLASLDEGKTWSRRGGARFENRSCDENMIVERRDGSLWMLVRLTTGIGETVSRDRGFTWSPGRRMDWPHPETRFFIRRLQSGALVMVKNHNCFDNDWGKQTGRSHLTAFLSRDEGRTWLGGLILDERKLCAYPDGVQAADGRLYVIYDRERVGAREVLFAVFTEEEVLAGKWSAPGSRRKVIIDRIPGV